VFVCLLLLLPLRLDLFFFCCCSLCLSCLFCFAFCARSTLFSIASSVGVFEGVFCLSIFPCKCRGRFFLTYDFRLWILVEFCVSASISPVQGCYIAVVWFPLCFFCYLCFTRFFPIIVIGFSPVETLCFVFCFFFPFILSGGPLDTSRFLEVFVLVVHVV